jgi:hypothetical protein
VGVASDLVMLIDCWGAWPSHGLGHVKLIVWKLGQVTA